LSEANFYQNEDHAIRAITSCYDPLKHPRGFSLNYYFYFETFSDRALHEQINLNNMIVNPSTAGCTMSGSILHKVYIAAIWPLKKSQGLKGNPGIEMNEELKSRLIGEAKFLRALYYYYFTKIFRNPPLIKETGRS
jgi:starch-binding outer membrane protein, SusD/RagB family